MSKQNPQSFDNIIDGIVKSNKIDRFSAEIELTTDEARASTIDSILTSLKGKVVAQEKSARDKLNDINNQISISSYQKRWSRLRPIQKIDRVKKYLANIDFDDDELKDIEKILEKMINAGGLKTDRYVEYNMAEAKIESMVCIVFNSKQKKYEFSKSAKPVQTKKLSIKKCSASEDTSDSDGTNSDDSSSDDSSSDDSSSDDSSSVK